MTAKKRNRKLAKKGKKASASASDDPATAAAAAANQGEKATVDEAQHQLQQFQIGNDDNATTTTTCSHGLFLPHDAIDKMKETLTKQVLASCDDLVLAKTPCVFQAIDRFIIGDCGADLVSSPYPSSKGLMTLITSYFEKLMEEKEPNIEKMGFVIVMFFAHMDHEDKVTSTAISQWVPSHFVAAGARCLIQGDVETAHAYAYFNCYFEQLGSLLKQKKQFDITKMIEMRNADVRTIVSYFRKRIPCSCLDRRYKEVKSTKKIGFCFNPICSNIPDPKSVLCCSRCRQANYCSSACQAADWNFHKKVCVQFKNVGSAIKEVAGDMNDASMTYEDFKKKEYFKDCNEQTIFDTVKKNFEENTESSVREIGTG